MALLHGWIFHRKSIGQGDRLLHKFLPPDGVAEIYVVAYPSVRYFSDGKSDSVSPPLKFQCQLLPFLAHIAEMLLMSISY